MVGRPRRLWRGQILRDSERTERNTESHMLLADPRRTAEADLRDGRAARHSHRRQRQNLCQNFPDCIVGPGRSRWTAGSQKGLGGTR